MVVMYDPDRMARRLSIQLLLTDEITKAGARLEFVRFDWQDTADGRLFYAMRGAISEYEREKILERTVRGKRAKVSQGGIINRPRTYGYLFDPETDTMHPDPETVPVVQQMFAWAQDGLGVRAISQRLAQLRVSPPGGRGVWWPETVSRILHSETYVGRLYLNRYHIVKDGRHTHQTQRPREEWVVAQVPAVVDEETWQAAQRNLVRNARSGGGRRRDYPCLLRGFAICAECGGGMTIRTKVKPQKAYCYYQCANAHGKQAYGLDGRVVRPCRHTQAVRTEVLDAAVWAQVARCLANSAWAAVDAGEDPALAGQIGLLRRQAAAADAARERTLHAYQRALLDEATFEREMRRLQEDATELRRRLASLEGQRTQRVLADREARSTPDRLAGVAADPDALDFEARRRVVTLLVERVIVGGDDGGRVTADVQGYLLPEEGPAQSQRRGVLT
jgi:site-specific DNA recombinase